LRRSAEELPIPIAAVTGCKPGPRSLQHLACGNLNAACRWGGVFVCASPRLRGKASLGGRRTCLYEVRVGVLPRGSRKLRGPRIHMRARDIPCESLRVLRCKTAGAIGPPSSGSNKRARAQATPTIYDSAQSMPDATTLESEAWVLSEVHQSRFLLARVCTRRNVCSPECVIFRNSPSVCRDVECLPTSGCSCGFSPTSQLIVGCYRLLRVSGILLDAARRASVLAARLSR
jgi:hypothetical protein